MMNIKYKMMKPSAELRFMESVCQFVKFYSLSYC